MICCPSSLSLFFSSLYIRFGSVGRSSEEGGLGEIGRSDKYANLSSVDRPVGDFVLRAASGHPCCSYVSQVVEIGGFKKALDKFQALTFFGEELSGTWGHDPIMRRDWLEIVGR